MIRGLNGSGPVGMTGLLMSPAGGGGGGGGGGGKRKREGERESVCSRPQSPAVRVRHSYHGTSMYTCIHLHVITFHCAHVRSCASW